MNRSQARGEGEIVLAKDKKEFDKYSPHINAKGRVFAIEGLRIRAFTNFSLLLVENERCKRWAKAMLARNSVVTIQ